MRYPGFFVSPTDSNILPERPVGKIDPHKVVVFLCPRILSFLNDTGQLRNMASCLSAVKEGELLLGELREFGCG